MKIFLMLFLLICFVFYFGQEKIISRAMEHVAYENFSANLLTDLPDGLHVVLCGAGSPLPDPKRSGPCTAVIAGENIYIVDSGSGSALNLTLFKVPQGEIDAVLLTHFHSDHIDGLGELLMQRWANAAHAKPLPVYGPEGVEDVVDGFNLAYRHSQGYRVAHHGEKIMIPTGAGASAQPFAMPGPEKLHPVLKTDDLRISAFAVDHEPVSVSVAYRFDYKGRSLVISGDTKKSKNLQKFSDGVDLLVHEALKPDMLQTITKAAAKAERPRLVKITLDILDYHTTPIEAAEIARDANVGHLLYHHIVPPLPFSVMEHTFTKGVSEVYSGGVTVGKDGTMITLEANSTNIELKNISSFM